MSAPSPPTDFKVIGAGLPRTGTASLQAALQILYPSSNGEPTIYHMYEILKDASRSKAWTKAFDEVQSGDKKVKFGPLVHSFVGGVDAPVSDAYIELSEEFPKAKVVLTYRPADEWWKSFSNTVLRVNDLSYGFLVYWVPEIWYQRVLVLKLFKVWKTRYGVIGPAMMDGRIKEAEASIPADRLLVYRVQEGWEPLCKFLEVPVPDVPFPRINDMDTIGKLVMGHMKQGGIRWLGVFAGVTAGIAVGVAGYSRAAEFARKG